MKKNESGGFAKNPFAKDVIFSIFLAIAIWFAVSVTMYPTIETTIYNVPVEVLLDGSYAQSNQLNVISVSNQTVNVTVSGKRSQVGDLKAEELKAAVDVSTVMLPRKYSLGMTIESESAKEFEVVSISPSTVNVTFDKIISKEFEVTPQLENVSIAQGYMRGDPIITPNTVTVSGPQDIINSITNVAAAVSVDRELSSTYDFTARELILYNNNAIISTDSSMITFDKSSFAIQIPVFVRQTLPLDVNIINAPENFDLESFKQQLEFSISELTLAAPNDKIKDLPSLNIGTINMCEVNIGSVFEFRTENFLPEGYENLTQTDVVTVTCPSEGLARKTIAIMGKNIQFINRPSQFDFTPTASGMTIMLVGDEEQIAELSSADITAQINLIDFDMQPGDHKMPVDFIISSYDKVWISSDNGVAAPKIYVTAEYIPLD